MASKSSEMASYFDLLPDEVRLKIFSCIDTPSIINLCQAYPSLEYLSHDHEAIHYVKFYKQYRYDGRSLHSFLTQKPRCGFIKVLNINCLYWVPAKELRKIIIRLPALECLYAVDTKLGVTEQDCGLYSSIPRLKRIALSLLGTDLTMKGVTLFPNVVGLYFLVYECTLKTQIYLKKLINKMEQLHDVWIADLGGNNKNMETILYQLPPWLRKATLILQGFFCISKGTAYLTKVFESRKRTAEMSLETCDDYIDIYRKFSISNPVWNALLNELHCDVPFGYNDARLLSLRERTLDNIRLEELNFYHIDTVCCIRLQTLIHQALALPSARYLKKLSINFCICDETWKRDPNLEPHLKRQKNEEVKADAANLQNVVKHCPDIEELEIWGCEQAWSSSIPSLKYIRELKKLKSLNLIDIPLQVDGSFLIDVCKCCKELRTLKVSPMRLNTKLNLNIREALKHATNLRDLRFEHSFVQLDQILEPFAAHSKLERLFVKCLSIAEMRSTSLEMFLKNNPQLVFVMIVIKEMSKMNLRAMQHAVNKQKTISVQCLHCVQDESVFSGPMPIPAIHHEEMVKQQTAVAVLNTFSGFA